MTVRVAILTAWGIQETVDGVKPVKLNSISPLNTARGIRGSGVELHGSGLEARLAYIRGWILMFGLAVLFCAGSAAGEDSDPNQCYRVSVDDQHSPLWLVSGVWQDESLLWIDAGRRELHEVSLLGDISVRPIPVESELREEFSSTGRIQGPAHIWKRDEGFIMEYRFPARIYMLDQELQPQSILEVGRARGAPGSAWPIVLFSSVPTGDGFLAFGDIAGPTQSRVPSSAFLFIDRSGEMEVLERIPVDKPVRDQYTRYYMPYLTSTEGVGYILQLDETPRLVRVDPEFVMVTLPGFPRDFQNRPLLVRRPELNLSAWEQEVEFYRTLENATLAAGLYSLGEGLFLLGKYFDASRGSFEWWLVSLDPLTGEEIFRRRLPTVAPHITLIPGPELTAVVEKEAVVGITKYSAPYMAIHEMVLVPTRWIEDPALDMLDLIEPDDCRSLRP